MDFDPPRLSAGLPFTDTCIRLKVPCGRSHAGTSPLSTLELRAAARGREKYWSSCVTPVTPAARQV